MHGSTWNTRVIRKPGHPEVAWFPLGYVGESECSVGILKDGTWVVETADGLADLHDERALTFIFRLLNSPIRNVREWLAESRVTPGLDGILPSEFPLSRLVMHAIASGGYWAGQAFHWLPSVNLSEAELSNVVTLLSEIEGDKHNSQELRHRAKQLRYDLTTREWAE